MTGSTGEHALNHRCNWSLDEPIATPAVVVPLRLVAVTVLVAASGGCLPRGAAPAGQQLTADGAYWFSTATPLDVAQTTIQVGAADDPTGPRYNLNPPGTFEYETWYLPDGKLSSASYDDQSPTMLAPEFTVRAFAEPQGGDLLAPDTRIVYQFQARAGSPYDGIWVVKWP